MQKRVCFGLIIVFVGVVLATAGFVAMGANVAVADEGGPLADAGLDQTVTAGTTVYLDAGGSVAPDGEIDSYEWSIETPEGETIEPECPECVRTSFVPAETGIYHVSVTVTDSEGATDTDTLYVEVEPREPPEASVTGPSTMPVDEERTFTVDAVAGDEPLSAVRWEVDGEHHTHETLESTQAVTHETTVTFDEPGFYDVNATVADQGGYQASDGMPVRVTTEGPYLGVTLTNVSSPVTEGDDLVVDATVENFGTETATQPVWLTRNGTVVDHIGALSLDPGERQDVSFTWGTDAGDAGVYELTAHTRNDTDSTEALVRAAPGSGSVYFEVEFASPLNETVEPGEVVDPTVRVTNTGTARATQLVTLLDIHEVPAASTEVTLGPGESTELTSLSWTPTEADLGMGDLVVQTEDDDDSHNLSVAHPEEFTVSIVDVTQFGIEDEHDDDLYVIAEITNIGGSNATQTLLLEADEGAIVPDPTPLGVVDERDLTLEPGESRTLFFVWEDAAHALTLDIPSGYFTYEAPMHVITDDDVDTQTVRPIHPEAPAPEQDPDVFSSAIALDTGEIQADFISDGVLELELHPDEHLLQYHPGLSDLDGMPIDPAEHEVTLVTDDGEEIEVNDDGTIDGDLLDIDEAEVNVRFSDYVYHEDENRIYIEGGNDDSDSVIPPGGGGGDDDDDDDDGDDGDDGGDCGDLCDL